MGQLTLTNDTSLSEILSMVEVLGLKPNEVNVVAGVAQDFASMDDHPASYGVLSLEFPSVKPTREMVERIIKMEVFRTKMSAFSAGKDYPKLISNEDCSATLVKTFHWFPSQMKFYQRLDAKLYEILVKKG